MDKISKDELLKLFNQRNEVASQKFEEFHAERKNNDPNTITNNFFKAFSQSNDEMIMQILDKLNLIEN
ncbi:MULTISPECIES: hypothetical protein [Staphylococcus]|uniref:hypothetical protein n=1 Tax=Staphylococcus TaxID=1279 RepID=UPI00066BBF6F|nr:MULTISPECIES: hypothetical protein [Staphylococcus]MCH4414493.1 hypothetical protein [Staphylococcus haemolyticus]